MLYGDNVAFSDNALLTLLETNLAVFRMMW